MGLWQRWHQWREQRVLLRRAIPDRLWTLTLARLPFLADRSEPDLMQLRRLATLFLDSKEFTGAGGLVVTDEMAVCIAAQACLPVLHLGLEPYRGFVGIVVHPDEVIARRSVTDDDGLVHEYDEVVTGEAMEGGPVMLSWRDVSDSGASAEWGYNVVIHEFAHVLDMGDGAPDGIPPLPGPQERLAWADNIGSAYQRFCQEVEAGQDTLLDPYGATGVDEFFAVASESFFVTPKAMRDEHAALYALLSGYYKQDPAL